MRASPWEISGIIMRWKNNYFRCFSYTSLISSGALLSFISPDCWCYCARHVGNVIKSITTSSDVSDCLLQLSFCNLAGFFISFISIKEVRGLNCARLKMDYENHIDEQKIFEERWKASSFWQQLKRCEIGRCNPKHCLWRDRFSQNCKWNELSQFRKKSVNSLRRSNGSVI